MKALPWYKDGLRFACTQCGRCCSGPNPGHVWVDQGEIQALADATSLSFDDFARRYVRQIGRRKKPRYSLIEKANNDCIFWSDEGGCAVYEARPRQCREFPFWPELLESPEDWEHEGQRCPGMNRGRLYSSEEIQAVLQGQGEAAADSPS